MDRAVYGSLLANNGETVRRMAVAGLGLARIGDYHARNDLASGALVEVLSEAVENDTEEVHAVFLGGARLPQRVRVFLDYVVPRLQAISRRNRRVCRIISGDPSEMPDFRGETGAFPKLFWFPIA